jgi:Putative zinc-finger
MTAELTCSWVQDTLWDYLEGTIDASESQAIAMHLRECRDCNLYRSEARSMRVGLKSLPAKNVPLMVSTRLHVIASRERSRSLLRRDLAARLSELRSTAKLLFDNLLKPIAVPAAGGMLASLFCFVAIVDTLHFHPEWQPDMPVGLFTQVTLNDLSPFSVESSADVLGVQLTVDPDGAVSDFELPQGKVSAAEMREVGNLVLFSTFKPATSFGQPVTGKIRVDIRHINIRG